MLLRIFNRLAHVARHGFGVVGNNHRASAEHIAGADEDWIADLLAHCKRLFNARRGAAARLRNVQILEQLAELFAVFSEVN